MGWRCRRSRRAVRARSLRPPAAAATTKAGREEGTGTVSVLSLWGGSEKEAFQKVLAQFTADTGIKTKYETGA